MSPKTKVWADLITGHHLMTVHHHHSDLLSIHHVLGWDLLYICLSLSSQQPLKAPVYPFCRWVNWGLEREDKLLKVEMRHKLRCTHCQGWALYHYRHLGHGSAPMGSSISHCHWHHSMKPQTSSCESLGDCVFCPTPFPDNIHNQARRTWKLISM